MKRAALIILALFMTLGSTPVHAATDTPKGLRVSPSRHSITTRAGETKKLGVTALVRSLRNSQDLEYEKNMFYFNMEMTGIETIFFLAKPELEPLNSTRMRELHAFGQDVSAWVPENVSRELRKLDEKK